MPQALSDQQRAFCAEYIKTGNATSSAKSAGYSEKTSHVQGCQLLKRPLIAAEIARLTGKFEKKSELTAEKILAELSRIAFFDPKDLFDENGKLLDINKMPEDARRAIAGIETDLIKGTKLRIASKLGALELGAKILQLVKQEQNTQAAVQIIISEPKALEVAPVKGQLTPSW